MNERPGGGQSFGGGGGGFSGGGGGGGFSGGGGGGSRSRDYSSHSSSGGSSGDVCIGDCGFTELAILFALAVVGLTIWWAWGTFKDWQTSKQPYDPGRSPAPPPAPPPIDWARITKHDPNFSPVLFEDFLYELYTRLTESRPRENLGGLVAYIAPAARQNLLRSRRDPPVEVEAVVVGAMTVEHVAIERTRMHAVVHFQANYTERASQHRIGYYSNETWYLSRKREAKSRDPVDVLAFNCPSCGGPLEESAAEACSHCGVQHATGEVEWVVDKIAIHEEQRRPPGLTGYAVEHGTDDPTRAADYVHFQIKDLQELDPLFELQGFEARVRLIYDALNEAWTSLQWDDARPFLSDRMWKSMRYWIEAYRDQNLRNVLRDAAVSLVEVAKVAIDPHYQAITVRLHAQMIDYTVQVGSDKVVAGDTDASRRYTEYWTLIRAIDCRGPATSARRCPACGGKLKVSMAGNCEYCSVAITAGAADWVLSKIEQDEVYRG